MVACQDSGNQGVPGGLKPDDVLVHNLKIDWAMKSKNPVDMISFYHNYDSCEKFHIPKEKVSSLIPDVFQERKVRVYSKRTDEAHVRAVEAAFLAFQHKEARRGGGILGGDLIFGGECTSSTPQQNTGTSRPVLTRSPCPSQFGSSLLSVHRTPVKPSRKRAASGGAEGGADECTPTLAGSQAVRGLAGGSVG